MPDRAVQRRADSRVTPAGAVGDVLDALRAGVAVVLYDERRDRADVIAAAEMVEQETVALMAREAGGVISVALTPERCRWLGLRAMAAPGPLLARNDRALPLISIEARDGVSTGISAADRARTIRLAAIQAQRPSQLVSPGHVFPVPAASGGLFERQGRIEAALDAMRLAGLEPAAAICDVLDHCGELGGLDVALDLSERLGLARVSIGDLADVRFERQWEGG